MADDHGVAFSDAHLFHNTGNRHRNRHRCFAGLHLHQFLVHFNAVANLDEDIADVGVLNALAQIRYYKFIWHSKSPWFSVISNQLSVSG